MLSTKRTSPSPHARTAAAAGAGLLLVAVAAVFGACGSGSNDAAKNAATKNTAPPVTFADKPDKNLVGVFETTAGRVVVEFLPEYAPTHTLVFQNLFRQGFFDGMVFYRVIPKQAVQAGGPNSKDDIPYDDNQVLPTQRHIPAEITPKIHHARGTVSAAHPDDDIDGATSQFFISTKENRAWDGRYTIFARVVDGMDVVDKMADAPLRTDDNRLRDRPVDPVKITKAYLAPRDEALPKGGAKKD
jgi:cyclophilin family peptidyl-prolyl cis-trans isomerase